MHNRLLAGNGQLAVATALACQIDDYRACAHPFNRCGRDQLGSRPPGNECGRHDDVEAGDRLVECLLLGCALLVGELACISAFACGFDTQVKERCAERLDLLGNLGANVVAGGDGAEAAGGGKRLQACDPGSKHEHLGRRNRARGGHQHREESGQLFGGEDHCLVAGNVALGRERVNCLRAADPRHCLHRKRRDLGVPCGDGSWRARQRRKKTNQQRVGLHRTDLLRRWRRDRDHDVGTPDIGRLDDLRSRLLEGRVGDQRALSGALLDNNIDAAAAQLADDLRNQRDAPLVCSMFLRDGNLHRVTKTKRFVTTNGLRLRRVPRGGHRRTVRTGSARLARAASACDVTQTGVAELERE
uniref:Unannotated protein n=1 Tax=freshwater metagenome TaxID=449393 RepID=A0A6J6A168_9ZZZZ